MRFKTYVALGLAALLAVLLTGCAGDSADKKKPLGSSSGYAVNIMAYAAQGEIPELKFKLGTAVDQLKATFKDTLESGSEIEDLTVDEGEKSVWLDGGSVLFCYEKAKLSDGISVIVAKEYAYGFSLGGVSALEDVLEAVGEQDYKRAAATENDVYFLPVIPQNCECVTYQAGDNLLKFIFIDNYLSAVALMNPANWSMT